MQNREPAEAIIIASIVKILLQVEERDMKLWLVEVM